MTMDPAFRARALEAYRAYNGSPMQERFRKEAPVLVGAVYWNPQQDTAANIRYELERMKATGFTFVRFHATDPLRRDDGSRDFGYADLRFDIAHEVGLEIYPHFGFHRPHPADLADEGLDEDQARRLGVQDERVARAVRRQVEAIVGHYRDHPAVIAWPLQGEPPATGIPLRDEIDRARFRAWLESTYDSPAEVHRAWLIYPDVRRDLLIDGPEAPLCIGSWDDAVEIAAAIADREPGATLATTGLARHELFGANRDLVRFRADSTIESAETIAGMIHEVDPDRPVCYGNHQFFYANGQLGWDQHGVGRTGDMHFSSIHLSWHFESVQGEFAVPHYLQSRLTADVFKGGYTNCYETTGGPVQYSGGYGNHMDAAMMRRLMCDFLAAGNEGSAFWCWNPRPGGIEAGEYGLVSLAGRVTPWAEVCGEVAAAMERHRHEIWNWECDPELAIVRSWDTETVMTCEHRRFECDDGPTAFARGPAQQHVRAWIGAGRVAVDAQIDFEYLTTDEILAGLAGVYPTVCLPHVRCVGDDVLDALRSYVEAGGRVVADVQIGFEDQWGKLRRHGEGTPVERLFGAWIDNVHDAATRPQSVDGVGCPGFFGDLVSTSARVLRRFATGAPAVTEARIGRGSATLIAFDAARSCWKPGDAAMQDLLAGHLRGETAPRWSCDVPQTVRRRHADADHYFVINDGPARSAVLRVFDGDYATVEDVLGGGSEEFRGAIPVEVPAYDARWLRCARR